jgi:hypothetical protein
MKINFYDNVSEYKSLTMFPLCGVRYFACSDKWIMYTSRITASPSQHYNCLTLRYHNTLCLLTKPRLNQALSVAWNVTSCTELYKSVRFKSVKCCRFCWITVVYFAASCSIDPRFSCYSAHLSLSLSHLRRQPSSCNDVIWIMRPINCVGLLYFGILWLTLPLITNRSNLFLGLRYFFLFLSN